LSIILTIGVGVGGSFACVLLALAMCILLVQENLDLVVLTCQFVTTADVLLHALGVMRVSIIYTINFISLLDALLASSRSLKLSTSWLLPTYHHLALTRRILSSIIGTHKILLIFVTHARIGGLFSLKLLRIRHSNIHVA